MSRINQIQVYGERCSGSNYLEHLLKRNLAFVRFSHPFGWKHGFHPEGVEDADQCLFIVIHRHPYDWIRSLHRNPWHAAWELRELNLSEFIRREWWCVWDQHAYCYPGDPNYGTEMMEERSPESGERFANVLRMRVAKLNNWIALRQKAPHCLHIRYEDLKQDPVGFVFNVAQEFGIMRRRILRNVTGEKGASVPFVEKSYGRISSRDMHFMRHELDTDIEEAMGYDLSRLPEENRQDVIGRRTRAPSRS